MSQAATDFASVTELSGDEVTTEQIDRAYRRYIWGSNYCIGKDALEVACGSGFGVGLLARKSKSFRAGDYDPGLVSRARNVYDGRIEILELDAVNLPFSDQCLDVIMIFEAVYYIDFERFLDQCVRLVRPGGCVLVSSANKDLFDFNPSPHSTRYYGVVEFGDAFRAKGFDVKFYGCSPVSEVSLWQKILRPVKKWAVSLGMIPSTMAGKKMLKRLVFGGLRAMPAELREEDWNGSMPEPIPGERPDTKHKIIYCEARRRTR